MSLIVLVGVCGAYVVFALVVATGVFKLTHRSSLALLTVLIVLIAPIHEGVFGYPEFRRFDAQHQGTPVAKGSIAVDGFLVEGRGVSSPLEAVRVDAILGNFQFKEFKRDMLVSLKPAPTFPLATYVQFYRTGSEDPTCTQKFESNDPLNNCVGVTTSVEPKSEYAVLNEPDQRETLGDLQLNESKIFPIRGTHSRVRNLKSSVVVAEVWQFRLPSKVFPVFAWFSKRNPPGQTGHAGFALSPRVQ